MELEKWENAGVFLWLGLPCTLIRHENDTLLLYCAWTENILRTDLFENDGITTFIGFPLQTCLNTNPVFVLRRNVDEKKFDAFFEVKSPFSNSFGEVRMTAGPLIPQESKRHITVSREYIFDVY